MREKTHHVNNNLKSIIVNFKSPSQLDLISNLSIRQPAILKSYQVNLRAGNRKKLRPLMIKLKGIIKREELNKPVDGEPQLLDKEDDKRYWTSCERMTEYYWWDFNRAKTILPTLKESEYLKLHVLPQYINREPNTDHFFYRIEYYRFVDFLMERKRVSDAIISEDPATLFSITDQKNSFDGTEMSKVYNHFLPLVESGYLSEADFIQYLRSAFIESKPPVNKFAFIKVPRLNFIYDLFYRYYAKYCFSQYGNKDKYAALIGDYFEGYITKKVAGNFAKYTDIGRL